MLTEKSEIDYRIETGKWIKCSASFIENLTIQVDCMGKDITLNAIKNRDLLAPAGYFTDRNDDRFFPAFCGQSVMVWALFPPEMRQWVHGEVVEVEGCQALVKYENLSNYHQHWVPLNRSTYFEIYSFEEYECKRELSLAYQHEFESKLNLQSGSIIRVLDSRGFWCMAQILRSDTFGGIRILVHYERWHNKFDEWICLNFSEFRVCSLIEVENNPLKFITEEASIQTQADIDFRKKMNEKNLDIVSVPSDGNCLYSSFAHQIFGDMSKHADIRHVCCQYMVIDSKLV